MDETYYKVGDDSVSVSALGNCRFVNLHKGDFSAMLMESRNEKPSGVVQDDTKDETTPEAYKEYTNSECGVLLVAKWEQQPLAGADAVMADCMHAYAVLLAHRTIPLAW